MSETEVAQAPAENEVEKGVETPRKSKLGSIKATVLKPFKVWMSSLLSHVSSIFIVAEV